MAKRILRAGILVKENFMKAIILLYVVVFFCNGCATTSSNESTGSFFAGTGGSGMRLGIIVPQGHGLNENQEHLPTIIQGVLVTNINRFSAISVLDRVALDRVLMETLDPTYEDNLDIVRLGHVAQVGYMMTGNIIRTSSGFNMQLTVTDTTPNAATVASFSGTFTEAQITNHSAINRASAELLAQMDVQLTESARRELAGASSTQNRNAQFALAQGIAAERRGLAVEAMLHYFDASAFDSVATESLNRLSSASATIATGSLGANIRNDIQQRNDWIRLIRETNNFFINNPPYAVAELFFNSDVHLDSIDYGSETARLGFPVQVRINAERADAIASVFTNIENGLNATGRRQQWGIDFAISRMAFRYTFVFELANDRGRTISTSEKTVYLNYSPDSRMSVPAQFSLSGRHIFSWWRVGSDILSEANGYVGAGRGFDFIPYFFNVIGSISQNELHHFMNMIFPGTMGHHVPEDFLHERLFPGWWTDTFFTVRAANITDTLSINLRSITVEQLRVPGPNEFYRRIRRGNNVIPVHVNRIER